MPKIIVTDIEKCTGCKLCALACSLAHYKSFSLQNSRLSVKNDEATNLNIPFICEHCGEHFCAYACPTGAIGYNEKLGIFVVEREKCTGCALCVKACPYKGIKLDKDCVAIKCDLCGNDPECVKYCVFPQAIQYVEADEKTIQMKLKNMMIKLQNTGGH
jgi:Fe-S-cluster-containing hydrogenase component 2